MKAGKVRSRTGIIFIGTITLEPEALRYSKQTISSTRHFWVQSSPHIDPCVFYAHNTEPKPSHVDIFT